MYEHNYEDITQSIKGIETKFPVHELKYKNVHVWPLLKTTFNYQFYRNSNKTSYEFESLTIKKNFKQRIGDVIASISNYRQAKRNYKKYKTVKAAEIANKISNSQFEKGIFLTFTSFRNQKIKGGYLNAQSDPFLSSVKHPENVAVIEFTSHNNNNTPHYGKTFDFDFLRNKAELKILKRKIFKYIRIIFSSSYTNEKHGFDKEKFEAFLSESKQSVNFIFSDLANEMNLVLEMKDEFVKIFSNLNLDYVANPIYCALESYAMTLAANELGIKSIEVQHGAYSHPLYLYSCKIPVNGFEMVPSHFLSWDAEQNEVINSWAKNTNKHNAIIYGINPLTFWLKNISDFKNDALVFLEQLFKNNSKIHILFTISDFIDDKLISLIEQTKESTFWYIRNHPRALNTEMVNNLISKMSALNCNNYETINTTNAPLYSLLKSVDFHLTSVSSIVTEAAELSVPSIVISESGVQFLKRIYDNNPLIEFETSLPEILKKIKEKRKKVNATLEPSYFHEQSITELLTKSETKS